ncbi:EAL domain-containing protein [Chitinilyticum piscinae]|uniref:EAL domain-containing protein n=1 Tax=Chitinilyticum piscinae TaxID=2866724 RepID=A0A8J7G1P7_9NEIS|nr:EAL domain-containing protein [Chitinilyticum piscinae]MBE9610355.1 EAL domain-containing protein [Chitinilyticum piscinae]
MIAPADSAQDSCSFCFDTRLARALAAGPHALMLLDPVFDERGSICDFLCVFANAAAARELRLPDVDHLQGKQIRRDWANQADSEALYALLCSVESRQQPLRLEQTLTFRQDEHNYRVQIYPAPPGLALGLRNIDQEVQARALADDYTHRLEAAVLERSQALEQNALRARALLGALRTGIVAHSADGCITEFNPMAAELLGLSDEQLGIPLDQVERSWVLVDEQGNPVPLEQYPNRLVLSSLQAVQDRIYGISDGATRPLVWCLTDAFPRLDADGKLCEVIVHFVDITSQMRQKTASQRSRLRAEHMLYLQSMGTQLDEAGLLDEIRQLAMRLTDSSTVYLSFDACAPQGSERQLAVRLAGSGNEFLHLAVSGKVREYDDVDRQLLEDLGRDCWLVLHQLRLQHAWQADRKRMQMVIGASRIGIWEYEILENQRGIRINREYAHQLGYPAEHFSEDADGFRNRLHPDDRERVLAYLQDYLGGTSTHYQQEFRLRDSHGQYRHILSSGEVVERYPDGQPRRMMGTHLDVTDERQTQARLRAVERQLSDTLNSVDLITVVLDTAGGIVFCSEHLARLLGYQVSDLLGQNWFAMFGRPEQQLPALYQHALANQTLKEVNETHIRCHNGGARLIRWHNTLRRDPSGSVVGTISIGEDITAQQQAQNELKLAATVFDNNSEGVLITDAQFRIVKANRAFCLLSGQSEAQLQGSHAQRLFLLENLAEYRRHRSTLRFNRAWQGELQLRRRKGNHLPIGMSVNCVLNPQGQITHYVGVMTDISERKRQQAQIEYMAYHDPLTGLPNRLLLADRFLVARARADREQSKLALLFIDLDRFKLVNDTLGHPTGDMLLQLVSARLHDCIRECDTVARLGGDEFLVLLSISHAGEAIAVASKILETMAMPLHLSGRAVHSGASIGVSLYPDDGQDFTQLQQRADTALYLSKQEGRNTYRFYHDTATDQTQDPLELDTRLRQALRNGELRVHYQPQIELESGKLVGFEALVRWQHPQKGAISPAQFIPLAEETGFILDIGAWVLRESCRQMKSWLDAGYPELTLAVNLSAIQFSRGNLVELVRETLQESGLPARCLELELTESVLLNDAELCRSTLNTLSSMGVQVSIDDFGTGYSCLSYLKDLDVSKLKIDRSFVIKLNDERNRAIVKAIISLAQALGLTTLAEGVETPDELLQLHRLGCAEIQGYFCGRPQGAADCTPWLDSRLRDESLIVPPHSVLID